MMIEYSRIGDIEIFSDDRALVASIAFDTALAALMTWLEQENITAQIYLFRKEPMPALNFKGDAISNWPSPTQCTLAFNLACWRIGDRYFRAATCNHNDKQFQILGPEVQPGTYTIIGPSPVKDIFITPRGEAII